MILFNISSDTSFIIGYFFSSKIIYNYFIIKNFVLIKPSEKSILQVIRVLYIDAIAWVISVIRNGLQRWNS